MEFLGLMYSIAILVVSAEAKVNEGILIHWMSTTVSIADQNIVKTQIIMHFTNTVQLL